MTDVHERIVREFTKHKRKRMEEAVATLIKCLGENPHREGLRATPKRVVKALIEKTAGYDITLDNLTTFNSEGYDQMIVCGNIQFHSMCEHHLENFSGIAHVAYIPDDKLLGASKPARVVEMFARRLQNQERIAQQTAQFISDQLNNENVAVIIKGVHDCMRCRGVKQQNSDFTTSAMFGAFRKPEVKTELFELLKLEGAE